MGFEGRGGLLVRLKWSVPAMKQESEMAGLKTLPLIRTNNIATEINARPYRHSPSDSLLHSNEPSEASIAR